MNHRKPRLPEIGTVREVDAHAAIVTFAGDLDIYSSPSAIDMLGDLISRGYYDLVVDLRAVPHIDMTGLGVLVGMLKRAHAHGGEISLVYASSQLTRLFNVTGLVRIFGVYDDDVAALRGVSARTVA
jgi:anti-sigma B factor antagonist